MTPLLVVDKEQPNIVPAPLMSTPRALLASSQASPPRTTVYTRCQTSTGRTKKGLLKEAKFSTSMNTKDLGLRYLAEHLLMRQNLDCDHCMVRLILLLLNIGSAGPRMTAI